MNYVCIIFFLYYKLSVKFYTRNLSNICYSQYLNCRGDASPHRELAPPHRDLGVPSSRFKRWMIRQERRNSSPNFGEKPLQFSAKTFFLVFIQFRLRNYVIFTKVLSHAKCVWSGLQKRPPMQNFTI